MVAVVILLCLQCALFLRKCPPKKYSYALWEIRWDRMSFDLPIALGWSLFNLFCCLGKKQITNECVLGSLWYGKLTVSCLLGYTRIMTFEETMTTIVDGFKLMSMTGAILFWHGPPVTRAWALGDFVATYVGDTFTGLLPLWCRSAPVIAFGNWYLLERWLL